MIEFVQIMLLVTVIYLTLVISVQTLFGDYTRLFAMMTAMLIAALATLATSLL